MLESKEYITSVVVGKDVVPRLGLHQVNIVLTLFFWPKLLYELRRKFFCTQNRLISILQNLPQIYI